MHRVELVSYSISLSLQVLFQANFPTLRSHPRDLQFDRREGYPSRPYPRGDNFSGRHRGPFSRSFAEGRRIFSSGRSLVGAGGWTGWGVSREEFNVIIQQSRQAGKDLPPVLLSEWSLSHRGEMGEEKARLKVILKLNGRRFENSNETTLAKAKVRWRGWRVRGWSIGGS